MKILRFFSLLFFISALCLTVSLQSMSIWNRIKSANIALKLKYPRLHSATETTALLASVGYPLGFVISRKQIEGSTAASPEVEQFAQKEFHKVGLKKHVPVKVLPPTSNQGTSADFSSVYLDNAEAQELHNLLKHSPQSPKLDTHRGILQHEGIHIKEKHSLKALLTNYCSLLFTNMFIVPGILKSKKLNPKLTSLILAPTIVASALIPTHMFAINGERRADNGIQNDPAILRAQILQYQQLAKYQPPLRELYAQGHYKAIFNRLTDTHDDHKTRAEQFEKRLEKLGKEKK
jgi:hypothetical protein